MRKIFNLNESAEYNYISLEIASSAVIKYICSIAHYSLSAFF